MAKDIKVGEPVYFKNSNDTVGTGLVTHLGDYLYVKVSGRKHPICLHVCQVATDPVDFLNRIVLRSKKRPSNTRGALFG